MQQHLLEGEFQAQFSIQFLVDPASATKESTAYSAGKMGFRKMGAFANTAERNSGGACELRTIACQDYLLNTHPASQSTIVIP